MGHLATGDEDHSFQGLASGEWRDERTGDPITSPLVIQLHRPVPDYGRRLLPAVPNLSPYLDILGSGWICML